jgi:hypothetical protein
VEDFSLSPTSTLFLPFLFIYIKDEGLNTAMKGKVLSVTGRGGP